MFNLKTLIVGGLLVSTLCHGAPSVSPPRFDEVYRLLQTNLDGVTREQLDRAAVRGLIDQLGPSVRLDVPGEESARHPGSAAIAQARIFDKSFAYVRVGIVNSNLPAAFLAAWHEMTQTNHAKIKGVVLDLRFASGGDYAAAAQLGDCFLNSDRPLLDWQSGSAHATRKPDAILLPVAVLVNARTRGAAEALAGVLRENDVALLIGGTTSGRASIFKEFPLSNGDKLRIAVANVTLGDGKPLTNGLAPDIAISVPLADEEQWLNDPYKMLHTPPPDKSPSNTVAAIVRPRFNEAELVREHAAGEDEGDIDLTASTIIESGPPVIADPVLARALDLLKGLAVIQPARPG